MPQSWPEFVIPSYKRPEQCRDKTLSFLSLQHVDPTYITVFVANEEEAESYKKTLLPDSYGRIVIGKQGLREQRNFISDYFPAGKNLMCFDDDVAGIYRYVDSKTYVPITNFNSFVAEGFYQMRSAKTGLWGMYPVLNAFFMGPQVRNGLWYIVGSVYGCVNRPELRITAELREDMERTLLYYESYGSVVRLDYAAMKTTFYATGGLSTYRTEEKVKAACLYLLKRYPDHLTINVSKKTGYSVDLKLSHH